eukprot:scaffold20286_cov37-Attheya_sp.AAC.1
METVDKYVRAWMLNKSRSPGVVEVEALESLFTFVVSQSDFQVAQIRLHADEIDLHGFLLFQMRLIDPSHHTAWEMACWGRVAEEHAHWLQGIQRIWQILIGVKKVKIEN